MGAGERKNANDVVTSGTLLSIVHGIVLTLFSIGFARYFVGMFTDQQPILEDAVKYAWIVFAFTIPNVVAITFEKIFQAEGRMKVSMISMLCGCVVNIILDPMLIFGIGFFPKMGIAGAALATGIGQVIPLVVYIIIFVKRPMAFRMTWHKNLIRKRLCKQMYGVGIPATLNLALPSFMITALNGILAVYSETYVLVLGIYYKLQTFIYLSANGIVQGIRPIISYNYGAGESARSETYFPYGINYDCCNYGSRNGNLPCVFRKSDGTVYRKCTDNCRGSCGNPYHLYGIYYFVSFGYGKWNAGSTGKRSTIPCDFVDSLYYRYYSGSVSAGNHAGRPGCLELFLDCGNDRKCSGICFV